MGYKHLWCSERYIIPLLLNREENACIINYSKAADDVKERHACDVGKITSHVLSRIHMFQRKVVIGKNSNSPMNSVRFITPKTLISTEHW